jgi:hypothetical protein
MGKRLGSKIALLWSSIDAKESIRQEVLRVPASQSVTAPKPAMVGLASAH